MLKTAIGLRSIEPASVWVLLLPDLRPRIAEFKQRVIKRLPYVRFRDFEQTHLMVVCAQYRYEDVEKAVETVLVAMQE